MLVIRFGVMGLCNGVFILNVLLFFLCDCVFWVGKCVKLCLVVFGLSLGR